jgi:tetratricopeptide (TPR) repeat protein
MIGELEGKSDEALTDYQRAIDMGDRQVAVIRQVVRLLHDRRHFAEADQLLRRLQPEGLLSGELRMLAAEISLRNADTQHALEYAAAAVPADSQDANDLVWLSQVLQAAGRHVDALPPLQRAVRLAGASSGVPWLALVHYHLRQSQKTEAEEVISLARRQLKGAEALPTLALCYEVVGRQDQAEAAYTAALRTAPRDPNRLRDLARFYQRAGSPTKAVAPLRQIIRSVELAPADVLWVRRTLAECLASDGNYAHFQEALALISENLSAELKGAADLYVKARILASRPYCRRQALEVLQQLGRQQPLSSEEEFFLAELYVDRDRWPEARQAMLNVLARDGDNRVYVYFFAKELLQRGETTDGTVWLDRLERLAPADVRTVALRVSVLARQDKAKEAEALITNYAQMTEGAPQERSARLRAIASLLEQLAGAPESGKALQPLAELLYRKAADPWTARDSLALAQYLGRQGQLAEALALCEEAHGRCPLEEVALAATAVVFASPASAAQCEVAQRYVKDALSQKDNPARLAILLAHLQARGGRYTEAEATYRAVLARDSSNASVLNNLAFVLAMQNRQAEEAFRFLEQALKLRGPDAELLDTRGVVHLRLGETDRALADFQGALDQAPTAVRYFHVAQACHRAGRIQEAQRLLAKAKASGVARRLTVPAEQQAYQDLCQGLGQGLAAK